MIFGVKKFHQYLYGRKFTLVTDYKPLIVILGPKKCVSSLAAARLQRWAVLLFAYKYDIKVHSRPCKPRWIVKTAHSPSTQWKDSLQKLAFLIWHKLFSFQHYVTQNIGNNKHTTSFCLHVQLRLTSL